MRKPFLRGTIEMAIREFSPEGTPRAKIAFVGGLPEPEYLGRFKERDFFCDDTATLKKLSQSEYAAELDALIWTQDPKRLNALPQELRTVVANLLNHDVRVYIRLATARSLVVNTLLEDWIPVAKLLPSEWRAIPESHRERENSFLMPCVYIVESASAWSDIATLVCDRPAGPPPKAKLKFDEEFLRNKLGSDGHAERVMLLKRAFWNCSQLQLTLLDGGMSGAPVFKVYASLEAGLVRPDAKEAYPHLYFVKIGPRKKIVDEHHKYCDYIVEYVPFHLGPRLRRDRCNLGSTQGILVGDFVEGTESLITCARAARCGHAISSLFDRTLGGWRKQKHPDPDRSLSNYLENKWHIEGSGVLIALPHARAEIVRHLGGDTDIAAHKAAFEKHGNTSPLVAPAHGDMHATNVLVRHGDAILIDFEKLEQHYPLTYDPASLEAGLLVEGFIKDLKKKRFKPNELIQLIAPLYEQSALKGTATTHCRPGDPTEWYFDAVNQIRTLSWAAENEPGQYALTLALCLIRKGCNTHESLEAEAPSMARAIAFFFGQQILREIAQKTAASGKTKRPSRAAKR
jgi:Ternary complex associated domain 9